MRQRVAEPLADSNNTRAAYDAVAAEYADRIYGELQHKPFDRDQLDRLIRRTRGLGPLCDLGCGPGQVARYLHDHGAPALGVDFSPGQLAQARRLNPDLAFLAGDMLALPVASGAWAGAAAFYSLIHVPRPRLARALHEIRRALCLGGWLLASFHIGQETIHLDEWWGAPVSVDFLFFEPDEMVGYLRAAGYERIEVIQRGPYAPEVEHQSRRAYIFAQKAAPRGLATRPLGTGPFY
jgi:SAM-dependent methyltransferase